MAKVSVIIPIYNVAPYIERCARSLFEQSLNSIEYIFIDDCTPDDSVTILQSIIDTYQIRLEAEEKTVTIVKMPTNSGLTAVRRQGIELASGDYVIHCDSDDWVDTTLYEEMYNEAIRSRADVVVCPICDEYIDHNCRRKQEDLPATCPQVIENWYKNSVGMFCWNKLVRRSIYTDNDIQPFYGINMWEDNGLMLRVFYYANGLSQTHNSVYHYNRANVSAMTNGYGRKAIDQMIECASRLSDFFESRKEAKRFNKTVLTLKFLSKLNLVTTRFDWLREFNKVFPESNVATSWINLNAFSTRGRIRFLFVKYHLAWLFVTIFKIRSLLIK